MLSNSLNRCFSIKILMIFFSASPISFLNISFKISFFLEKSIAGFFKISLNSVELFNVDKMYCKLDKSPSAQTLLAEIYSIIPSA